MKRDWVMSVAPTSATSVPSAKPASASASVTIPSPMKYSKSPASLSRTTEGAGTMYVGVSVSRVQSSHATPATPRATTGGRI